MPALLNFPVGLNAYDVLGVNREASDDEIRQAYRALALKCHPDKAKGEDIDIATQRFQEIQIAYEALSPVNRAYYDAGSSGLTTGKTDLMAACERADTARVQRLLEESVDVCERDSTGRTALMFASGAADVEAIRLLLTHGADLDARNCAGHSCVMFAVGAGLAIDSAAKAQRALRHLEAVRLLLDEGAMVDAATCYGLTPLMLACTSGRLNMIELLLARGADANANSDIGLTALVMAADRGHAQAVQLLVKASANPNQIHASGRTPLMGAAAQAHTDVVIVLLENKAEVETISHDGQTPLLFAVAHGLKDGLVCPIQGAEVQKPGVLATVDALLQARADTNIAGPMRRTPLHLACASGNASLVERLIMARADTTAMDEDDQLPVHRAGAHKEVLYVLRSYDDIPPGETSNAATVGVSSDDEYACHTATVPSRYMASHDALLDCWRSSIGRLCGF